MVNRTGEVRPEDALKEVDQICTVDLRNRHISVEKWHKRIADIRLNKAVPLDVKQVFEISKNIALYAYFSYRLHQSAEIIGFTALELALKLKYEREKERLKGTTKPKNLFEFMKLALAKGWVQDEGCHSSRPTAALRIEQRKIQELVNSGGLEDGVAITLPEPEEAEIDAELRAMGVARKRLHAGRLVRNNLLHDPVSLGPSSIGTLRTIAEDINQVFAGTHTIEETIP